MNLRRFLQSLFVCFTGCYLCEAQIPVVHLQVQRRHEMQFGVGWPNQLTVTEGHEALLKVGHMDNPQSCSVTTPQGTHFDIGSPPSSRYERWSEGCGIRVKNVVESDEGRWRLTATSGQDTVAGWTELIVSFYHKDSTSYVAPEIFLLDGQTETQVELTTLDNTYCMVAQPFSESSLVPGHCRVTLHKATRAVQGNWNVLLGLPGRVAELPMQRRVAVEAERLDVGYVRDTNNNKLNLYCNILNTMKNITFCRFQKTASYSGFNIKDGLSDGSHSYYGDGFSERQCGMTIEQPATQDYGTWRCSVGVKQWVGTTVQEQTPLQALISVGPDSGGMSRSTDEHDAHTVFVQEDQQFTVMCRSDESLAYCWFQHPNGTQFTPVPIENEDSAFWYTGEGLNVGECGITFKHATQEDAGNWTCHMGPLRALGVETTDKVDVRVTGPLAANMKRIPAVIGESITLYCHSANGNLPLDYCRFLTPTNLGFRIDSSVTEETPILNRYYFTPGRNLDYGDCSLTIKTVEEQDFGNWSCAALINNELVESRDTINVYYDATARAPLSRAGIAGMAIGITVLFVVLAGTLVYKKEWHLKVFRRNQANPSRVSMFTTSTTRASISNSETSNTSSEVNISSQEHVRYTRN